MSGQLVQVDREGAVCTLTLDSPHNRNALSSRLLAELADGLRDATTDRVVRAIVVTGTGSVFCSGADLKERDRTGASRMPEILTAITSSPAPVIVRVNGHARAGGLGLLAAADMAVAASASTFAFSEVRVGVAPALILVPAHRVVGRRFLARATLTGAPFTAEEAAQAGLLTEVVPDTGALDAWVHGAISGILQSAPGAVAATKALLNELPDLSRAAGLAAAADRSAELFAGAEAAEGMDAFVHKRRPAWDATAP